MKLNTTRNPVPDLRLLMAGLACGLLFLGSTASVYAQQVMNYENRPIMLGLHFAPELSYRQFTGSDDWLVSFSDSVSQPGFGWTVGTDAQFRLTSWLSLGAGVSLARIQWEYEYTDFRPAEPGDPTLVPVEQVAYENDIRRLEIPVRVRLFFLNRRLKCYALLGANPSFHMRAEERLYITYLDDGDEYERVIQFDEDDEISQVNVAATAGLGISFGLLPECWLSLEPEFRYYLRDIQNKFDEQSTYPWSAGARVGIYWSLQ